MSRRFLVVPGLGNSPPDHWQSLWEKDDPAAFRRISLERQEWTEPRKERWVGAIEKGVRKFGPETVLVAHSLGCLALLHWATSSHSRIKGALLVSPPDPSGSGFPDEAVDFAPIPLGKLPFATHVVASTNDPYATLPFIQECALDWGAGLDVAGALGHISQSSGLGDWSQGKKFLERLVDRA